MNNQRSIIIFNHAISSESTKIGYLNELKRFMKFHKIRDYDSLTTIEPKKLNIMIEDYVMSRIGKAERSSLNHSLSALDLFFSMNDITLNFKKIKKLVPKQEYKLSGMRAYTVDEIRELIEKKLLDDYFTEEANIFVTVKLAGIKYTIGGEIGGPGVKVDLVEQLSLLDAIVNSGDITEYGDRTDVLIIRQYPGGKKIHHIDLTKIEALNSPYYYVQPNDVILVNPLPQKSLGIGTTGLQSLTTVVSILTLATTTILLFSRL